MEKNHGGNGKTGRKARNMQDKFVKAIVEHKKSPSDAKRIAGYSQKTHTRDIIRPDGPVFKKLQVALEERGITPDRWASEYVEGLELSKQDGSKNTNLNAHAQYLKQIQYVLSGGSGKQAPQVAVQINNQVSRDAESDDPARLERLEEQMSALIAAIEAEEGRRELSDVHEGDTKPINAEVCDGVDAVAGGGEEPADRGES